ncbi:phage holin family protein [Rhodonellum sp.]|uniref:phage holin family protein n=1 Tax=Rhodonellum sp. TaxID=2231180 RepID=UPI00271E1F8C|nr:phage holin family protein [Rhodonellum sp.]MDO9554532.1 phage holin family protein [Rhodonellum sp.]
MSGILKYFLTVLSGILKYFLTVLHGFGYKSVGALTDSLAPSLKYSNITVTAITVSGMGATIIRVFGMDSVAFLVLLLIFICELVSGLMRANFVKEEITSARLSRFSFKVFYYLLLIAISYLLSQSFFGRGKDTAAIIFDWMHLFFVVQIVLENVVSISENMAVLEGKPKSHWITALQEKINGIFK